MVLPGRPRKQLHQGLVLMAAGDAGAGHQHRGDAVLVATPDDDTVDMQAGAGLVADSVPELEYQETVNKARAVLRAVAMARTAREGL